MPEFHTIDLPDVSLRVAMEGAGPLVVLVHGFPESWYTWRPARRRCLWATTGARRSSGTPP